jgi:hypothetical protein
MGVLNTYGPKPGGLTGIEEFIFASTTETYNCTIDDLYNYIKTKLGAASAINSGYLTNTDWSTFNNKLSSFSETDPVFNTWLLATPPAYPGDIPTTLAELSDDSTHRLVTDIEKGVWNGKQDALGYTAENTANKSSDVVTDGSSTTKYPTVKAIKDYADGLVTNLWDDRGSFDASINTFPVTGGSGTAGAILKGDIWTISIVATSGSLIGYSIGSTVRAVTDTPGQTVGNWAIAEVGLGYVPENAANKVTSISGSSSDTQYPSAKLLYDQLATKQSTGSYELTANKEASSGYAGLSGYALKFWNAAKTFVTTVIGTATQTRAISLPDDDGTIALTKNIPDITGKLNLDQTTSQTIANGQPIQSTLTASELVATDANKKLQSLALATYPSFTELSYVKNVTSAIQTQLNSKNSIAWHGTYDNAHAYVVNDAVYYLGSSYICKLASTSNLPTNTTYWDKMSAMGDPGVSGLTGALTTPFTSQTSVTVTHNFGGYPAVQVIDNNNLVLIPLTITHNSVNDFTVTFAASTSGNIVCTIGGVSSAVVTKTGDYTITATDNLILVSATATMTLPATTGLQGKRYYIKHIADNGVVVTVNTTGSKTIDGESTKTLVAKYTCMLVFTDGTNWFIL